MCLVSFTLNASSYKTCQYDEEEVAYPGVDRDDEVDVEYEETEEVLDGQTGAEQDSALPVREVCLPERALPSPALTGTSSRGSFPRPPSPLASLEELLDAEEPPVTIDTPATEEPPVIEETPAMKAPPVIEETPISKELPLREEPIVTEDLPITEEPPEADDLAVSEESPVTTESKEASVQEGLVVVPDALAIQKESAVVIASLVQGAPPAEDIQEELPAHVEKPTPEALATLGAPVIVQEPTVSEDLPPLVTEEDEYTVPAEDAHSKADSIALPNEDPFSELSSLADNNSVSRSGTEDETTDEHSEGEDGRSDDSLSSLSDFDGDSQPVDGPNGPRRSKRSRTHVASYNYRRRKRPRRENQDSDSAAAGESISAAGSGSSRARTLSAKVEDRPAANVEPKKRRKKHQPGYFTARQRRQTLADQKRRQELAEEVADWPFRTKKAGAYSNVSRYLSCAWRSLIGP
jgi:hypothetical protein